MSEHKSFVQGEAGESSLRPKEANIQVDGQTSSAEQATDFLEQPETSNVYLADDIQTIEDSELTARIIAALKEVYDPEIPVNVYDLGLIYDIRLFADYSVYIQMTLTSPGCPVAQTFPGIIEQQVRTVEGVEDVEVDLVWDPPWSVECMSEATRLELGILY